MKITQQEIEHIQGNNLEEFLQQREYRLGTSPFGAAPGKAVVYIGRSVRWKRRGRVPHGLFHTDLSFPVILQSRA